MAYTTNPEIPKLRARAVNMVRSGKPVSEVAKGAVSKWCARVPQGEASKLQKDK